MLTARTAHFAQILSKRLSIRGLYTASLPLLSYSRVMVTGSPFAPVDMQQTKENAELVVGTVGGGFTFEELDRQLSNEVDENSFIFIRMHGSYFTQMQDRVHVVALNGQNDGLIDTHRFFKKLRDTFDKDPANKYKKMNVILCTCQGESASVDVLPNMSLIAGGNKNHLTLTALNNEVIKQSMSYLKHNKEDADIYKVFENIIFNIPEIYTFSEVVDGKAQIFKTRLPDSAVEVENLEAFHRKQLRDFLTFRRDCLNHDMGTDEQIFDKVEQFPITKAAMDLYKERACILAAGMGNKFLVDRYLEEGVNINASYEDGTNALMTSVNRGRNDMVQHLLRRPATEIEHVGRRGHTPLIAAACRGHSGIVALLLNYGANREAKSDYGMTAEEIARDSGHHHIVKLLRQRQRGTAREVG